MSDNRVLVGLDGSPGGQRALEWAQGYAKRAGAEIIAAHVLTYTKEFARDLSATGLTTWRQRLRDRLHGPWTDSARKSGVTCRYELIEHDSVAKGLLGLAEKEDVELIVLGAHGRKALTGRLLGAVTYKVSHAARRPVVIVPVDWHVDDPA